MKGKYEEVSNNYKIDIILIYSKVIGMVNLTQTLVPDEFP